MHSRLRPPFLIGLIALAAVVAAFVAASGYARSAYAQEPPRTIFSPAAPTAALATALVPASQPEVPAALPATSGERSSTLVTRAAVGVLLLMTGVIGRLVLRRRAT